MRFPPIEPTEQLFTGDLQDFVSTNEDMVDTVSGCTASIVYASDLPVGRIIVQWCKNCNQLLFVKADLNGSVSFVLLGDSSAAVLKRKDNMLWNVLDQYMTNNEVLINFSDPHTANINCDIHKYLCHLRHLVHHVPYL